MKNYKKHFNLLLGTSYKEEVFVFLDVFDCEMEFGSCCSQQNQQQRGIENMQCENSLLFCGNLPYRTGNVL